MNCLQVWRPTVCSQRQHLTLPLLLLLLRLLLCEIQTAVLQV
jgi:hypothetical protein